MSAARGGKVRVGPFPAVMALAAALAGSGVAVWGCGTLATAPSLSSTFASPHALASAVADAVARKDLARLQAIAVTEYEFRSAVWPWLPASQPVFGMPVDYAWRDHAAKSAAGLQATLERHGGRRRQVIGVANAGETDYGAIRIRRDTVLTVRDEGGQTTRIRLFGSLIEQGGRVKVFSYIVD